MADMSTWLTKYKAITNGMWIVIGGLVKSVFFSYREDELGPNKVERLFSVIKLALCRDRSCFIAC